MVSPPCRKARLLDRIGPYERAARAIRPSSGLEPGRGQAGVRPVSTSPRSAAARLGRPDSGPSQEHTVTEHQSGLAPRLEEVADHVFAYVQPDGGWCLNNAGVIVA